MITNLISFRVGKSDGGRCDDAVGTGGRPFAFAVADGLGSSPATSGYFAQEAADWYVQDPSAAKYELSQARAATAADTSPSRLATRWTECVHTLGKYLDNPQISFEKAGCTLVGVHLEASERGDVSMSGLVIGDCAIFIIDEDQWAGRNNLGPLTEQALREDSGEPTPNALSVSFRDKRPHTIIDPEKFTTELFPGTTVILATDALADWIHQRLVTCGAKNSALHELLQLRSEARFVEWVQRERFSGHLEVDDVAIVCFTVGGSSEAPAKPAPAAESSLPPASEDRAANVPASAAGQVPARIGFRQISTAVWLVLLTAHLIVILLLLVLILSHNETRVWLFTKYSGLGGTP